VTPETDTGHAIAVAVMLVGIGFVAILTGAIAQRFIAPQEDSLESRERDLHAKLDELGARLERLEAAVAATRDRRDN
jgi:voltage-gated potassium channel